VASKNNILQSAILSGVNPATGEYLSPAQRKAIFRSRNISSEKVFGKPGAIVRSVPSQITPAVKPVAEPSGALVKRITILEKQVSFLTKFIEKDAETEKKIQQDFERNTLKEDERKARAGKEGILEKGLKKIISPLASTVGAIGGKVKGVLDTILDFFGILFAGWLTDKGLNAIAAFAQGDTVQLESIRDEVLKTLGIVGGVFLAINGGLAAIPAIIGGIIATAGLIGGLLANPVTWLTLAAAAGIGAGAVAAAKVAEKVETAGQKLIGGAGTTKDNVEFTYTDVVDYGNERKRFMTSSGYSAEAINSAVKPINDLMMAMKEQKRINDTLWNMEQAQKSGDIRFNEDIKRLNKEKIIAQQKVTELATKAGLTGNVVKQIQMREGRRERDETYVPKQEPSLLNNLTSNTSDLLKGSSKKPSPVEITNQSGVKQKVTPGVGYPMTKDGVRGYVVYDTKGSPKFTPYPDGAKESKEEIITPSKSTPSAPPPAPIPQIAPPSSPSFVPGPAVDAQPQIIYKKVPSSKQGQGSSLKSGSATDVPSIPSSNPDNFYTLYSQMNYNVVI
jgi:hypothetical protein